jgi:hypothetical protein
LSLGHNFKCIFLAIRLLELGNKQVGESVI